MKGLVISFSLFITSKQNTAFPLNIEKKVTVDLGIIGSQGYKWFHMDYMSPQQSLFDIGS